MNMYFHKKANIFADEVLYQSFLDKKDLVKVPFEEYEELVKNFQIFYWDASKRKVKGAELPVQEFTYETSMFVMKQRRNTALNASDWVAIPDVEIKAEIKAEILAFRKSIRKIEEVYTEEFFNTFYADNQRMPKLLEVVELSQEAKKILGKDFTVGML